MNPIESVEVNSGRTVIYSAVTEIFHEREKLASSTILTPGEKEIWKDYKGWKESEYSYFLRDIANTDSQNLWQKYQGTIGEAIFLIACREQNIPIKISSGKEDLEGFDFFIFGYPVDVTTGFSSIVLRKKLSPNRVTTLFLPQYIGQNTFQIQRIPIESRKLLKPYLYDLIESNTFPLLKYMQDLMAINNDLKNQMDDCLYKNKYSLPQKLGLNNLQNLKIILKLLSCVSE